MTEREALLRAVCDNPDDDTPRLVFADWLDENGEPERAEFIRVQVAAEQLPLSSIARRDYFLRERELLAAYEAEWREKLSDAFYGQPFVRGFVETAQIGQQRPATQQEVEPLFETTPLVELYVYRLADPGMLATVPRLTRLRRLHIGLQDPPEESVDRFLNATNLVALRSLIVFTSSPVGWNSPEVPPVLAERFRLRFGEKLVLCGSR